jgi:hypothetical protein
MANPKTTLKLVLIVIGFLIAMWIIPNIISVVKVEGDEAYVRQHLLKGVVDDVYRDGTHFYCGFFWDIYRYDIGTNKVTFDNKTEHSKNAEYPSISVNVGENGGQSAWISLSANYRLGFDHTEKGPRFNKLKLVAMQKDGLRETYQDIILKRTIVEVVNKIARPNEALEIYSGQGYNNFVEAVEEEQKELNKEVEKF